VNPEIKPKANNEPYKLHSIRKRAGEKRRMEEKCGDQQEAEWGNKKTQGGPSKRALDNGFGGNGERRVKGKKNRTARKEAASVQ